jgi:type IV pilus assembly protein PilO
MQNLSLKNIYEWPLLLRIFVCIVVSIIFFYLGYIWHFATLEASLAEAKKSEEERLNQMKSVIVKQIALQKQVAHFADEEAKLTQWKNKMGSLSKIPDIINEILKTATANNIHFNLFDPGSEVKEGDYLKIPIKAIAVGDYHQFANFLSKIANMDKIIAIRNFTFLSPSEVSEAKDTGKSLLGSLVAELNFEVYYFAPTKK